MLKPCSSCFRARCESNTPDAVAIEVWQDVANNKGEAVEREVGCSAQGVDDGSLLFSNFSQQLRRTGGSVEAIGDTAPALLAHSFRADCCAAIRVRTRDNRGEKVLCRYIDNENLDIAQRQLAGSPKSAISAGIK